MVLSFKPVAFIKVRMLALRHPLCPGAKSTHFWQYSSGSKFDSLLMTSALSCCLQNRLSREPLSICQKILLLQLFKLFCRNEKNEATRSPFALNYLIVRYFSPESLIIRSISERKMPLPTPFDVDRDNSIFSLSDRSQIYFANNYATRRH